MGFCAFTISLAPFLIDAHISVCCTFLTSCRVLHGLSVGKCRGYALAVIFTGIDIRPR
ncbi:hypothetical protein M758_1G278600 [Ceratodon purpureus]|uniref:Uncharacterized protein n=1 Tax=Ceratodon purpureus TaxID=3225 RepID=A0A8T0JC42_CERPU|nr:hypothetical protein KC19_1G287100 [Ceratodon purpureus]KAG0631780.1 hypothetical protein M758_1G278600 [Ceratodon purpureus]